MRLHILGCRGSTPAPGPGFVRYGGDTSCVALASGDSAPTLILDAGTGLRHLGRLLGDTAFRGTILLSHLHWDHTHGLPFCPPIDEPESEVRLFLPEQGEDPKAVLARAMSPPHFPISTAQLNGAWEVGSLDEGTYEIEGYEVTAAEIDHKGGRTFGYRVSDASQAVAYLPDHSVGDRSAIELARGVDLLIHDAQYTTEEQADRAGYGHCSIPEAIGFAEQAEVVELLLFHHDFNRTDDELDRLMESLAETRLRVSASSQGRTIQL